MTVYEAARDVHVRVPVLPRASTRSWERTYITGAAALDAGAAALAGWLAYAVRFAHEVTSYESLLYPLLSVGLPLAWVGAIAIAGGYDRRFLGVGSEEFRRLTLGALGLIALVGTVSWATQAEIARGYVVIALPLAAMVTAVLRYWLRKHVHHQRRKGRFVQRTLVVGHMSGVDEIVTRLRRKHYHGYQVVGACVPAMGDLPSQRSTDIPVVGDFSSIAEAVTHCDADTVAVLSCPEMDGEALRQLAWDLESTGADLVVAPTLIEVAGPRLSIRPVEGLPLLHVDQPAFSGARRVLKAVFDRCLAVAALIALAPVLALIAVGVKATSEGPVLFRQARVGRLGQEFTILKFRTMTADAEQRLFEVAHLNEGDGPLFKARTDPRVTRLGAFLRRTSLDELPQLVNVLRGQMSLVGPRPHLATEVALFGDDMTRRLLVKPGLTGLWQISGRSDLTWEESVRVDLRYVENWSFMADVFILWKTLFVVLRRSGAY